MALAQLARLLPALPDEVCLRQEDQCGPSGGGLLLDVPAAWRRLSFTQLVTVIWVTAAKEPRPGS